MKAARDRAEEFSGASFGASGAALVLGLALGGVCAVFGLRAREGVSVRGGRLARRGGLSARVARGHLALAVLLHTRPPGSRAGTNRECILARADCQYPARGRKEGDEERLMKA